MKLDLDFQKLTISERLAEIQRELNRSQTLNQPLTPSNLSTLADYILWHDHGAERKTLDLNSTWTNQTQLSSLDALREENPAIDNIINSTPISYTQSTQPFSRNQALRNYPNRAEDLYSLWKTIDVIALATADKPSDKLIKHLKFSFKDNINEGLHQVEALKSTLTPYKKLKLRHQLIELRTQQYELAPVNSDFTNSSLLTLPLHESFNAKKADFAVFPDFIIPESLNYSNPLTLPAINYLDIYTNDLLGNFECSTFSKDSTYHLNLYDSKLLSNLILNYYEIEDLANAAKEDHNVHNGFPGLYRRLNFIIYCAAQLCLSETQFFILLHKMDGEENNQILRELAAVGGPLYQQNYVSTIFRQRIITSLQTFMSLYVATNNAAYRKHYEKFKECAICGRLLLIDNEQFAVSSKTKDGFSFKCKWCSRKERMKSTLNWDYAAAIEKFNKF